MTNKTYSKQSMKTGLHWWFDTDTEHITMRMAWKPSLVLEEYRKIYEERWDEKYLELLSILKTIWDKWLSPFVFYSNELKD